MSGIAEQNAAHRRFGAVYFTSLSLAGVRCFGPEQTLNLASGDHPAKWTVILGENGVGKTTILQCAWAMAPYVAEVRPGALAGSYPRGSVAAGLSLALRRSATSNMSISAIAVLDAPLRSTGAGVIVNAHIRSTSVLARHSVTIRDGQTSSAAATVRSDAPPRRPSKASASDHSAASLFSDGAELISGSEWLLRADYAANTTTDHRAVVRRDQVRTALIDLLPDVSDIRVAGLDEQSPDRASTYRPTTAGFRCAPSASAIAA